MSHEMPPQNGDSHEKKSITIITLTEEPDIQARLQAKLADYDSRINHYLPPESQDMDAVFKHTLLNELLEKGSVDIEAIYQELTSKKRLSEQEKDLFWNAVAVIDRYNRGTTEGLVGGKGF
jgi:hypothetical protein